MKTTSSKIRFKDEASRSDLGSVLNGGQPVSGSSANSAPMKWQILGMNVSSRKYRTGLSTVENGPLRSSSQIAGELECNRDLDEAAGAADAIACSGAAVCVG